MYLEELPRKQKALPWDGAWFCGDCYKAIHYQVKSYEIDGKSLCAECAQKRLNKRGKKNVF